MAGSGKRHKDPVSNAGDPVKDNASDQCHNQDRVAVRGFDGPADTPSASGMKASPFGEGLGYDPARSQPRGPEIPRDLELPPEAYGKHWDYPTGLPKRPQLLNSKGNAVTVCVNQYKVLQWPQTKIFQYDVTIDPGNPDVKKGLIKAVWNSPSLQNALKAVGKVWLYDGQKIAWSSSKLPRGEIRLTIDLDKEKGNPPRKDKEGKFIDNTKVAIIKLSKEVNMAVISGYLQQQMEWDNSVLEAINFLDHAMRQMPSECYTKIKRSFYGHGSARFRLDDCVEAFKGVYSSVRLCQAVGAGTGLAVNVDVANGTFWMAQALHQAARNYCKERNPGRDFIKFAHLMRPVQFGPEGRWTMSPDFKELRKFQALRFTIQQRGKQDNKKIYTITGFLFDESYGREGAHAKNVKFKQRDGTVISVFDYFLQKYDIHLEYHNLPLVTTTKDGMFPMEICTLVENQRYLYKTTPDQTANMIKFAVTRPTERMKAIEKGIDMLKWDSDRYLQHFGVKIDRNMTRTQARVLPNPEVAYTGSKVNPGTTGRWDLRGKKFLRSNTKPLLSWGFAIMDNCVDDATLKNFIGVFIKTYVGHGGVVNNKTPTVIRAAKNEEIPAVVTRLHTETARAAKGTAPQILLFVLKDKNSANYERLKKSLDCRFGVVSQMMQVIHIQKAQPQYCSNVCMKLNAKLGGTTCKAVSRDYPDGYFKVKTMIIGADVSHPSPGSPQASMAAITMSMDAEACRYAAAVQTNGYRTEMISTANIKSMFLPLFDEWISLNKGAPGHIYYFRDGVSEGQYMHVLNNEVKDMKDALVEKHGAKARSLKFTVIIASKRHHIRLFPSVDDSRGGDKNGNPLPGTLVERDVTHPFEYDFYLNSHSAIQGTARPVHYHVLLDEFGLSANDLQTMIYQHCYQYMRSTTPVSLYPAVYYAHLASNRARAHEAVDPNAGPRGGQKFTELKQANAGKPKDRSKQSVNASHDESTKAPLLLGLGGASGVSPEVRKLIKFGMWYI